MSLARLGAGVRLGASSTTTHLHFDHLDIGEMATVDDDAHCCHHQPLESSIKTSLTVIDFELLITKKKYLLRCKFFLVGPPLLKLKIPFIISKFLSFTLFEIFIFCPKIQL